MDSERSRRRVLQLSGCALCALSGCAGVANRLNGAESEPTADGQRAATADRSDGSGGDTPGRGESTDAGTESPTQTGSAATGTGTPASSLSIEPPSTSFADVPIPESPGDYSYAVMGPADATDGAVVFGNWKCPYTRGFVVNHLEEIVDRYVRPGDLAIQFRAIAYRSGEPFLGPDAPRAARAGIGVWETDPDSYWSYFSYVFGNQPPERQDWATAEHLLAFADAAGVADDLQGTIAGDQYESRVRATTDAAAEFGVFSVPRVVVNGEVTAPTLDMDSTLDQLDRATDG